MAHTDTDGQVRINPALTFTHLIIIEFALRERIGGLERAAAQHRRSADASEGLARVTFIMARKAAQSQLEKAHEALGVIIQAQQEALNA